MEDYFVIGDVVNTQGIKGEVRVIPCTDDESRFELLDSVFLEQRGKMTEYYIENVRYHKQFVLLKFEGVDDMTAAEKLKGATVKIPPEDALPLEEGEYYIRDLYDMNVVTDEGEDLGIIKDILFTGANDVYVVKPEKGKDILIPAIKECILDVDVENKKDDCKAFKGAERLKFYILTLFPEMIEGGLEHSILKRAKENNLIDVECINIRDFFK